APLNLGGKVLHLSATYQGAYVYEVTVDRWFRDDGSFVDLSSLRTGGPSGPTTTGALASGTYNYEVSGLTASLQFQFSAAGVSPFPSSVQLAFTDDATGTLKFDGGYVSSAFALRTAAEDYGPINFSNRSYVMPDNPAVSGFVVNSPNKRFVLLRAIGPGLANFQVSGPVTDPYIEIHSSDAPVRRIVRYSALDFSGDPAYFAQISKIAGAFPLDASLADSCVLVELPSGSCTVVVGSASGKTSGTVLVEAYFLP
ncbi:MAG TPA: hypothetical protein VII09_06470, partial [Opitutaceae bacterium]